MEDAVFQRYWRRLTFISFLMLIGAPPLFLGLMYIIKPGLRPTFGDFPIWLNVAYALPIIDIVGHMFVRKAWRKSLKGIGPDTEMFATRYRNFAVIRMSKLVASYLYGLVIFLLTAETKQMYYFYAIGILLTPFAWPRKQEYLEFSQEAQAP